MLFFFAWDITFHGFRSEVGYAPLYIQILTLMQGQTLHEVWPYAWLTLFATNGIVDPFLKLMVCLTHFFQPMTLLTLFCNQW